MVKSVTMVSDTDSTIISIDAWYRFVLAMLDGEELRIANYCPNPIMFVDDKSWMEVVHFEPKQLDYNFNTDEIIECERWNNPDMICENDNVRYSIISIMTYILDHTVNDYMVRMCTNQFSVKEPYHSPKECKVFAKNEFLGIILNRNLYKDSKLILATNLIAGNTKSYIYYNKIRKNNCECLKNI